MSTIQKTTPWFNNGKSITKKFNGVFEGGGAKGIAFKGALLAMREHGYWFSSVAGASSGAITASLIAAGFTPEEIGNFSDEALAQVRTPIWPGISRLEKEGGYFPKNHLRKWIKEKLCFQIRFLTNENIPNPNFLDLFRTTGLELNIVATCLSLKTLVIFSHNDTPMCSVADAVVASASIPFAFEDSVLEVTYPNETTRKQEVWHNTIVDGGVWSNFPFFIYDDQNFRTYYEREEITSDSIIGFILDEERPYDQENSNPSLPSPKDILRGPHVNFVDKPIELKPWEKRPPIVPVNIESENSEEKTNSLWIKIILYIVKPLEILGSFVRGPGDYEMGRWPNPKPGIQTTIARIWDGVLEGLSLHFYGGLSVLLITLSTFWGISQISFYLWEWLANTEWDSRYLILFTILFKFFVTCGWILTVSITILSLFNAFGSYLSSVVLRRSLRRIIFGLAATYVEGSGAPEWARLDKRIVFLPVGGIQTLDFGLSETAKNLVTERARLETKRVLEKMAVTKNAPRLEK